MAEAADSGPTGQAVYHIDVNYAHDWVAGSVDIDAIVDVTLKDGAEVLKDSATVVASGDGSFFVYCEDWVSGNCPDITPGDRLTVSSDGSEGYVAPIGELVIDDVDADADTVSGTLHAAWLPSPVEVRCEVWQEGGATVVTQAEPDGGAFTCDFAAEGWDLQPGQEVALRYLEPDGDTVIAMVNWPWIRIQLDNDSVGGNYAAGHLMSITVADAWGDVKATASVMTDAISGWGEIGGFETQDEDWTPAKPDIRAFDRVTIESDDGYLNNVLVGGISGAVDASADRLTGYVTAPFNEPLDVECHPWGAWEAGINDAPTKMSSAPPDGSAPFVCEWDPATEWDVQPAQRIGAMYIEPDGDRVIHTFEEPAPYLRIAKYADGLATADGNLRFVIEVWNDGSGPAEDVTLTDYLSNLSYLSDTSGVAHSGSGAGPIVWELGTLQAGGYLRFQLFVEVTGAESSNIGNTIEVTTTTPGDQGDPSEKQTTWLGLVEPNDTYLSVGKHAWTHDPAPGNMVVFEVNVCNDGSTASSEIVLTDDLSENLWFQNWWANDPGWYEVSADDHQLVVALPSLNGQACRQVMVRAAVDSMAQPGDEINNLATVWATNDLSPDDPESYWVGQVGQPRMNIRVDKAWEGGVLSAGGELRYQINYDNDGNVPAHDVQVTDTFPGGASFVSAVRHTPWGQEEITPDYVSATKAVWHFDELENGWGDGFEVILQIDSGAQPDDVLTNRVEITMLPGEERYDDNVAEWTEQVYGSGPNLRIHKQAQLHDDGTLEYWLHFQNIGSETVTDVVIEDLLPANTTFGGWWQLHFDDSRLTAYDVASQPMSWQLTELNPGESGWLQFAAVPDSPGEPLLWYVNTAQITLPDGDLSPADNVAEVQTFSGGEVRRVEFWVSTTEVTSMWGEAIPDSTVWISTPLDDYDAYADPACNGCWSIDDVGMLYPGDEVTITAGSSAMPVTVTVPDPWAVSADTRANEVSGQIDHLDGHWVQVYGYWDDGYRLVQTDGDGHFVASYDDIEIGAEGHVRFEDMADHATIVWHRPFGSLDLRLVVNYFQNWVNAPYEAGHLGWFDVYDSTETTLKASAEVESQVIPDWGDYTGFTTLLGQPWAPAQPDIVPGDWVYGLVDNGYDSGVRIGEISGTLDLAGDTLAGAINAPWHAGQPLDGWCQVWEEGGPDIPFQFDPEGGSYSCDFAAEGWDLQPGHHVAVGYVEPDGDTVMTLFFEPLYRVLVPVAMRPAQPGD